MSNEFDHHTSRRTVLKASAAIAVTGATLATSLFDAKAADRAENEASSRDYVSPNRDRAVLITIDTQNDFSLAGAPAEIPGTMAVIPNMKRSLEAFRRRGLPIIHVVRLYQPDGSNVDVARRKLLQDGARIVNPGTNGAELVSDLKRSPEVRLDSAALLAGRPQEVGSKEWVIYKPRWGAFYGTRLEEQLRELGVDTIVLTGCNYPNCPRTTLYQASERDFRLVMLADAVSGTYDKGLQEMKAIGVNLMTTDRLVEWVRAAT
jgi:nicotinamidase-related amidase